jgi:lysozyme family protein
MANFSEAYKKTMGHEGGYANDRDDAGGETYMGISRVYNPGWYGWTLIDQEKGEYDFPSCLKDDEDLHDAVEDFYKDKYWDVNRLDDFPSQEIANEMFDTGVNMGVGRAARFLQKALNYLNRNGSLYSDLVVDGVVGGKTISALDTVFSDGDDDVLLSMLNVLQGQHYMNYMDKNPTQKKYARGWFRRVKF